jgi:hypothetical protein
VHLFSVASTRPKRANQGRGGAVAQLQAISEQLTEKGRQKKRKDIPIDIPANAMAPSGLGARGKKVRQSAESLTVI